MSTPTWTFCEFCGGPMHWKEAVGKYNPVTGSPEMYWYYQCAKDIGHQPVATEPGETMRTIARRAVKVLVPGRK